MGFAVFAANTHFAIFQFGTEIERYLLETFRKNHQCILFQHEIIDFSKPNLNLTYLIN